MSRILRRPMFRGGRVDSRGTGITSGLNYAKGGRVGLLTGGSPGVPMVINTGASTTAAPQGITYRGIFDALKSGGRGMLSRLAPFNPFSAAGVTMALPFLPSYLMSKANEPRTVEALEYMKSMNDSGVFDETAGPAVTNAFGETEPGDYEAFTRQIDILNKTGTPLKDSGVGLTTNQEDLSKLIEDIRIKKEEEANKNKETNTGTGTGTGEPSSDDLLDIDKEKVAEYKEIFKDAYGSGVADDASAMALSFAKNALAPDATVKSAFAGFFDDESKRPSESKKYKDAATTAAINAYLTGEKSFQDTMRAIKVAEATTRGKMKILSEGKGWDDYLIEGAGSSGDPRKMGVINYAIAKMGKEQGGKLPELKEGQTYGEILEEGPVYVQDSPDGSFKILVQWDGEKLVPIKEIYKLK